MTAPIRYLSTLALPDDWLAELAAAVPDVEVRQITASAPDDVPTEVWRDVHVLHTSSVFPDPDAAPALRWVQLDTSGADHLRDAALWATDVPVTTIGGVSPVPLAEYVLWAVLGTAHRLPELLRCRSERSWPPAAHRWTAFMPRPLAGATAVVVGYGRIGRQIGRLLHRHGLRIVGVTRSGVAGSRADAARFVDYAQPTVDGGGGDDVALVVGPDRLLEVFAEADYAVVVAPLTDETRGLVDKAAVAALKPGAVVINVSRGGIVDEAALLEALRSGALAGVVLDVFEDEPLPAHSPWWDEPGCLVTPHVAGLAPNYARQVLDLVTQNLRRLHAGMPLLNVVDRSRGY